MRNYLSILVCYLGITVISTANCFAQYPMPNMPGWHTKYWFYRWRLRNDFMVMGDGPGQSLVAEQRNPGRKEYIKWSDCMIMHGYYLTMLAIEHKILLEKGRWSDLKNNERELYYAIKAFERVDEVSETFYSAVGDKNDQDTFRTNDWTLSKDVNGYFHRDDVPPDFINRNQWIDTFNYITPDFTSNYYKLTNNKTGIDYGKSLKYNRSAYSNLWKDYFSGDGDSPPNISVKEFPIVNYKNGEELNYGFGEASVDQIIRLLLGFFTITKSISDEYYDIDLDKDGSTDVSMNFNEEARRHSTNILGRLAGKFSGTLNVASPYSPTFWAYPSLYLNALGGNGFWTVINPRGNEVSEGSSIVNYMPPMQKVSVPLYTHNNDLGITNPFHAAFPSSINYQTIWGSGLFGYSTVGNVKMSLLLNTISNSGTGWTPVGRFIYNKSSNHHYQAFYTPLYDYLWGWDSNLQNDKDKKNQAYQYANQMLEAAPCVGPHNFGYTNLPTNLNYTWLYGKMSNNQEPDGIPYFWNTPFLFDDAHSKWDDGIASIENGNIIINEGWFSGVDYMLLYNLIYANNDGDKPLYHDLINRLVDYDINTDNYTDRMVYSAEGLMVGAFENLRVTNNIYGSTPVTLKALDYVLLDAGIYDPQSQNGSGSITIETGKITCGDNFTSSNTPYSRGQCETCDLDGQIGSSLLPKTTGKVVSDYLEMGIEDEVYLTNDTNLEQPGISVFPNPTNDYFTISHKFRELVLLDQNGTMVKKFDNRVQLFDISELSSGIYSLMIKLNDYETTYVKLVKL